MPTFFGRRYARGRPGWTERFMGLFVLGLLAALVGAFLLTSGLLADTVNRMPRLQRIKAFMAIPEEPLFEATHAAASGQAGAHFPPIPGAEIFPPPRIRSYTDDVYEKINGKESMYRAYRFEELLFGQYSDALGENLFDVYVFDMRAPANAMGIYMAERSRSAKLMPLGREGYQSDTNTYFWKDRFYVNVLGPPSGGDEAVATSLQIAQAIAGTMTDAGEPFWAEAYLPAEDRKPDSLTYQGTSALGYEFLNELFLASYETSGGEYQMFLTRTEAPAIARDLFERYRDATARYDRIVMEETVDGVPLMVGESLGVFAATFAKGVYFGGVIECADQELAVRRARALSADLPAEPSTAGPAVSPAPRSSGSTESPPQSTEPHSSDEY